MDTVIFVISKLVGLAILPEIWLLAALILALVAVIRGWRRFARWMLGTGVAFVLVVGIFPVGELLIQPIEREYATAPALDRVDGIIVLGGAENPLASKVWGQPQFNDASERLSGALELARKFPDAQVIAAGGSGSLKGLVVKLKGAESTVAGRFFIDQGLDPARLVMENRSRTTAENARLTLDRLKPTATQRFVLVTSAYHMPRAMRSFESAGWQNLTAWPVDYRSSRFSAGIGWNFANNLNLLNKGVKEWVGRIAYKILGR